ncbi:hypothetical protein XENOCAPTIV_015427, partial [Xenoophorus captivus]
HPYAHLIDTLKDGSIKFFNPRKLGDPRYDKLPLSVRILLEEAIRNCDGFYTKEEDVQNILDWQQQQGKVEVPFSPARVLLQDFTMPQTQVEGTVQTRTSIRLVQHQPGLRPEGGPTVEASGAPAVKLPAATLPPPLAVPSLSNRLKTLLSCVPSTCSPFLSKVVHVSDGLIYPDSVVGTDSHTTMINGLGVLGWGVGGIESEAVMLGQPVSLTLPQVVGCKLVGSINPLATSIDIAGISGKFVEFFGPGVSQLSAPDRTTIANMCPEYNATISFFPVDPITLKHFRKTSECYGGSQPSCLNEKVGFKGFHISKEKQDIQVPFLHCGQEYQLAHGSVVIAAVISCTNNCNPSVMLTAGMPRLRKTGDLVACGVLSGNRHFEGRLCDCVRANYLASPPLVVAYAIAGTVGIDFEKEPLGETGPPEALLSCLSKSWRSARDFRNLADYMLGFTVLVQACNSH